MNKIISLLKRHKILIGILFLGIFLRVFRPYEFFMYGHDHDLESWVVRDIVENKHIRLIGQETSVKGVFIGAFFYYLLIPFYVIFGMDPKGGIYLSLILGVFSIISYYFVFAKVFNKQIGLIAALIYAVSAVIVFTDREVVPTTPVLPWAVWFFYALHLLIQGKQKIGFLLIGVLTALIWHLNLGLSLLLPLVLVALVLSRKKIDLKSLFSGVIVGLFLSLPLLAFEFRHNFQQLQAIISSFTLGASEFHGGYAKFDRVIFLISVNIRNLVWGTVVPVPLLWGLYVIVGLFLYLIYKKKIERKLAIIMAIWLLMYVFFFSANSIIVSEYYLNGMTPVFIGILSIGFYQLIRRSKVVGLVLLGIFLFINLYRFFLTPTNKSGYLYRREIVREIKKDAEAHNYPCVSVSYITKPGYELGYRYLFYLEGVKVLQPNSRAPVYSIVFPHNLVDKIDKSIGALGLIYPDYGQYNNEGVEVACSGENSNITDPLFGYTQ